MEKFRDLTLRSGLFPFRPAELRPRGLTAFPIIFWYSEFDWNDEIAPYSFHPVALPPKERKTLALKLFRREPAITKFDKLFTSYHRSSDSIARLTGSGLPPIFIGVHPAHGKLTWLRV